MDVQIVNSNRTRLKLGKKEVELNDNDSIEKLASYLAKISCFKDNKMDIKSGERLFISSKNIEKPIKTTNVILKEVLENLESENAFLEKEISFEKHKCHFWLNTFIRKLNKKIIKITERIKMKFFSS